MLETTLDMAVKFWKVERADLDGADYLAKDAMKSGRNDDGLLSGIASLVL